jgi:hypothetical protein
MTLISSVALLVFRRPVLVFFTNKMHPRALVGVLHQQMVFFTNKMHLSITMNQKIPTLYAYQIKRRA